jgi:hypothetical protein
MTDGETVRPPGDDAAPLGKVVVYCLAIMSIAAAVIHFAIAAQDFAGYWLFSLATLTVSWLQLIWAIVVIMRPSRRLLRGGVLLNSAVFAGYVITQATGYAIGTAPHGGGLSAFGNGLGAALAAVLAAGCGWVLTAKPAQTPVRRRRLIMAPAVTGVVTAVLLGVALATAGPGAGTSTSRIPATASGDPGVLGMRMPRAGSPRTPRGASRMPGMAMPDTAGPAIRLANSTPAGDITMPSPDMQMMTGMRMASSVPCSAAPTSAQQQAAVSFVDTSWQDAKKYQSLAAAKAAGYRPITASGAPVVHYLNSAYYQATAGGGTILNTVDPQSLVYANTPKGAVLVAAMYITYPGGPTPQPGGCLTQWHVHTNLCLTASLDVVGEVGPGNPTCPPGSVNQVTPPMIHVWFVPIPGGPTAIDAPDQQVVQAAEQVAAPPNGTA